MARQLFKVDISINSYLCLFCDYMFTFALKDALYDYISYFLVRYLKYTV